MDFSATCTYGDNSTWTFDGVASMRSNAPFGSPCNYNETFCTCGADMIFCTCRNRDQGCADFSDWLRDKNQCEATLTTSRADVWPVMNGAQATTADVSVVLKNPAPSGGCALKLRIIPVVGSGGHAHNQGRPVGSITPDTVTFAAGTSAAQHALYASGQVSGTEKILAEFNGKVAGETAVNVKVSGLVGLTASSDGYWRLTGRTGMHADNHYGMSATIVHITGMALTYYKGAKATLGINDLSLEWGGLFDIDGDWATPHNLHRTGKSVDIDRCAQSTITNNTNPQGSCANGYIIVDKIIIEKICKTNGGRLANEATIHCEFH